jgi:2-enoate reductase
MLKKLIPYHQIEVVTGAKALQYADGKLDVATKGGTKSIACDSIVLAAGYNENAELYEQLQYDIPEIYKIGDARRVANILYAVWDAYEVASHIE